MGLAGLKVFILISVVCIYMHIHMFIYRILILDFFGYHIVVGLMFSLYFVQRSVKCQVD